MLSDDELNRPTVQRWGSHPTVPLGAMLDFARAAEIRAMKELK